MTARAARTSKGTGEAVAAARARRGETLRQLGVRLGVSGSFLCDIEGGRRAPPLGRVWRWAKILGIERASLIQLILQDQLDAAELPYRVEVTEA